MDAERAPACVPALGRASVEEGDAGPVTVERLADGTLEARARDVAIAVGRSGEGLRSTELLLAALGSCTLGTVLAYAANAGLALEGVRLELEPVRARDPERVAEIRMTLRVGGELEERRLAALRRVAEHCKVHATLEHGATMRLAVESGPSA